MFMLGSYSYSAGRTEQWANLSACSAYHLRFVGRVYDTLADHQEEI